MELKYKIKYDMRHQVEIKSVMSGIEIMTVFVGFGDIPVLAHNILIYL
jgi:hypothetical protein